MFMTSLSNSCATDQRPNHCNSIKRNTRRVQSAKKKRTEQDDFDLVQYSADLNTIQLKQITKQLKPFPKSYDQFNIIIQGLETKIQVLKDLHQQLIQITQKSFISFIKNRYLVDCYQISGKVQLLQQSLDYEAVDINKQLNYTADYICQLLETQNISLIECLEIYKFNQILIKQISNLNEKIKQCKQQCYNKLVPNIEQTKVDIQCLDQLQKEKLDKANSIKKAILELADKQQFHEFIKQFPQEKLKTLLIILNNMKNEDNLEGYSFTKQFVEDCEKYFQPSLMVIDIQQQSSINREQIVSSIYSDRPISYHGIPHNYQAKQSSRPQTASTSIYSSQMTEQLIKSYQFPTRKRSAAARLFAKSQESRISNAVFHSRLSKASK